jgi:hypothetical protein
MQNYYSSQPFLAWILNTYFYGDEHFAFVAPFYPYRRPNPSSSSPYDNYAKLYRPWKDDDNYDECTTQKRFGLRKGVMAKRERDIITERRANELKEVCDKVSLRYFCPVVYRVDLEDIEDRRLEIGGSGLIGSDEYLIRDLAPGEFDILLFDYWSDPNLRTLYEREENATSTLTMLQNDYVSTT